jgi:ABC-type sugar transport system ATPase subunit
MSLQDNITLGTLREFTRLGWLNLRQERRSVIESAIRFKITPPDPRRLVEHFSGGNQQKGVIAKAVRHKPSLLVLDEPFQGVDVGAKREIAQIITALARDGMCIILGSSDNDDLFGVCNRVIVLNRGRIAAVLSGETLTLEDLVLASGQEVLGV